MIQAWGTFIVKEKYTYRTSAYLQWGSSSRPLGAVIMLKPNNVKLELPQEGASKPISGPIALDPTMKELVELVELMKPKSGVNGRLYIYNLFPLQNTSDNNAEKLFNTLWEQNEKLVRNLPEDREKLLGWFKEYPWVLICWGCRYNSPSLRELKLLWKSLIIDAGTPILGKPGETEWDYYHPGPRLMERKNLYKEEILSQYYDLIKQNNYRTYDNIFDINDIINYKLNNIKKNIREYHDRYEYCIKPDYGEKHNGVLLHSIQLGDIFPILLEMDNGIILVAIIFYKSSFNLEQVLTWLNTFKVYIGRAGQESYKISKCSKVLKSIKFKGQLIATYYKGNQVVELAAGAIKETTKNYKYKYQKINTWQATNTQSGVTVLLNGNILNGIPKIELVKSKDIIISNGNCIVADYIDAYGDGIGFYRKEDRLIPVAYLLNNNTTVEIQITKRTNGGRLCVVKYKYYVFDIKNI